MFTDIVGYAALTQSDESLAMEMLERHNRLLRPLFPKFHGKEIKAIGDSFLVEFQSALDALRCAIEIQAFLHDYNTSSRDDWKIKLRIGIHLGDVVHKAGDLFGDAVNIASRLEPMAVPEGICMSDQVFGQVRNKVGVSLQKLAPSELKNIRFPVDVYRVIMPWEEPAYSAGASHLPATRIAVLPFVNISPDPNDEYFADGLTEEMISRLSRFTGLDVIARTSVMNYKKKEKNVSQIGRELGAGTILEGSVRKAGDKIRVTVQLIDSNTEGHLWAESYDKNLGDIFDVQSEVAEKVAGHLELRLLPPVRSEIERRPTENVEAYSLYLRGLQYSHEDKADLKKRAIRYFEQSIELDPNFALAYLGAARLYFIFGNMGYMSPGEARQKGKTLLAKAQELDPDSSDVLVAIAYQRYGNYEWSDTEALLRRAIGSSPSNAEARRSHAMVLQIMGRFDESLSESIKCEKLDPVWRNWVSCSLLYNQRKYDDAIAEALRLLNRDPELFNVRTTLAFAYLAKSMFEEAVAELKKNVELAAGDPTNWSLGDLALAYARSGRKDEATKILGNLETLAQKEYVPPDVIAVVQWALGNRDKALELFETAYEDRSASWIQWLGTDPLFDDLRSDERFVPFMRKIGFGV